MMYKLANKILPGGIADHNAWYAITRPWVIVDHIYYEIKYAFQRVYRGWDDRSLRSIDWYLAKQLPEQLRLLKKRKIGLSTKFFEDLPHSEQVAIDRENEVFNGVINGFDAYMELQNNHQLNQEQRDRLQGMFENGMDLFKKYFYIFCD